MSAHVLLNLLNELGKRDKMQGLPSILYIFFATSLINSIKQEHECRFYYEIKILLRSHSCRKKRFDFIIMYICATL